MRILVAALVTALLVFALATVASDLLLPQNAAAGRTSTARAPATTGVPASATSRRKAKPASSDDEAIPPVRTTAKPVRKPVRTESATPRARDINSGFTSLMQEQLAELRQQEARLTARQDALRMVYDDIRVGQLALDDLRRQVNTELAAAQQSGTAVAGRDLSKERGRASDLPSTNAVEGRATRDVAQMIRRLAQEGSFASAVALLNTMKDREAAKVLASLSGTDPQIAARLTDDLQSSKQPLRR
ncbi:MAG: hypothetical protein HZA46_00140 [Planctomycetales bacterium]|nr:hypothetical protein [Planctomycetales bacterium]